MDFSFNFDSGDEQQEYSRNDFHQQVSIQIENNENNILSEEINLSFQEEAKIESSQIEELTFGEIKLKKFKKFHFQPQSEEQQRLSHLLKKSDLVSGVYEGGFKLWECSLDLIQFLSTSNYDFNGKKVLELGCGHGLPGIYCMKRGSIVHFQDYNKEVLRTLTVKNILLNDISLSICNQTQFFCGDWLSLPELLKQKNLFYDLILTSETLYNTNCHKRLYTILKEQLNPNGKILIASKTYYFGVGGGMREFENLVKRDNKMLITKEKIFEDGSSNMREIISLQFK